jgi:hypothetical protein
VPAGEDDCMTAPAKPNESVLAHLDLIAQLTHRLDAVGIEVLSQEYQWESFGCWYVVVRHAGRHFRIDFEGRDRLLLAYRVLGAGERFTREPELVAEQPLEVGLTAKSSDLVYAFLVKVTEPGLRERAGRRTRG